MGSEMCIRDSQIVSDRPAFSRPGRDQSSQLRSTSIKTEKLVPEDDKRLLLKRTADASSTRETGRNRDLSPSTVTERERKKRRLQLQLEQNKLQQQLLELDG